MSGVGQCMVRALGKRLCKQAVGKCWSGQGKHWQWASSSVSMPTGTAAVSQSGSSATWHLWSCVVCFCLQIPNENKNTAISPPSHRAGAHFILGLYIPPVLELIICFKCIKTTMAIFKYPVIYICITIQLFSLKT